MLLGFKFLRLEADPMANLRKIDGDDAPRVTLPRGGAGEVLIGIADPSWVDRSDRPRWPGLYGRATRDA